MQKINRLVTWPIILLFLGCSSAFAADAVPAPDTDAAAWARLLYDALTSKAWSVVAGLGLVALVYPLRQWAALLFPWFKTTLGGVVLAFVISLSATMGAALVAHAQLSLSLIAMALSTAATAAGVLQWIKNRLGLTDQPASA